MATDPRDPKEPVAPEKEATPPQEAPEPFNPDLDLVTYIERGQGPKGEKR